MEPAAYKVLPRGTQRVGSTGSGTAQTHLRILHCQWYLAKYTVVGHVPIQPSLFRFSREMSHREWIQGVVRDSHGQVQDWNLSQFYFVYHRS